MSKQNLNIQVLRAVAALLVVAGHASYETVSIAAVTGGQAVSFDFFNWAAGIDIFFVISGFIMVYSSAGLFNQPGGMRIFLVRRLTRIVPLYWFLTSVMLLGAWFAPTLLNVPIGDWQSILASYLFIPALRAGTEIRPILSLGWTLNLEMLFYAIFACIIVLPYRYGIATLTVIISALAIFGLVMQPQQVQIAFWTQPYLLDFLFGSLLAVTFLKGVRLPFAVAALLAMAGIAGLFTDTPLDGLLPPYLRWNLPALMLVAAAAYSTHQVPRILNFLVMLGNASYSLYLVHPFILRPLRVVWTKAIGGAVPLGIYIVISVALSSIVALMLYRGFEKPTLRYLHRRLLRKDTNPAKSAGLATS